MNRLLILGLAFFVAGGVPVYAASENPFGFDHETHPLKHDYCKREHNPTFENFRSHGYFCTSAPRPHPDLHHYWVMYVRGVGVCQILAQTYDQSLNESWVNTNSVFQTMRTQLIQKYGPATSESASNHEAMSKWIPKDGFERVGDVRSLLLRTGIVGNNWIATVAFTLGDEMCRAVLDELGNRVF